MPRGADHPLPGYRLGPTLCPSPFSLWEERSRVAISTAWHWPPTGNAGSTDHLRITVMPNTFLPAHISPNMPGFVQAVPYAWDAIPCFTCLVTFTSWLSIPLVPVQTLLTLRCPFNLPWAGEVTCPSSAWPCTAPSTYLQDLLTTLSCPYLLTKRVL